MNDQDCVGFLQWALPQLGLRWPGYRKVRGQVCKRVGRRISELSLESLDAYRAFLESNPREWEVLRGFCHITISRFFRDRGVFEFLAKNVFPSLVRDAVECKQNQIRILSVGSSSGEEPYSLALLWEHGYESIPSDFELEILATEIDLQMIERAESGRFGASSLREIPSNILDSEFATEGEEFVLSEKIKDRVRFECLDIRERVPPGPWELILCRNLVYTYFEEPAQKRITQALIGSLRPGGGLVLGIHEHLPGDFPELTLWSEKTRVYRNGCSSGVGS